MGIISFPQHPHNDTLVQLTAPPDWQNPTPDGKYNLVVIGAGSAGVTLAQYAARFGAKVALIEKNLLGGDCLVSGCVPSKALIRAAKVAGELKKGAQFGISADDLALDFAQVMAHVWQARAKIAPHDSAEKFRKLGVDLYFGAAQFTNPNTVEVDGQQLTFAKSAITTGSRPRIVPIPGLQATGFLTNETLWNLTTQPKRLAIIGAGPIGVEMAQAFQRLGTQVTLIEQADTILPREDRDAAAIVQQALEVDGVDLRLGVRVVGVEGDSAEKQMVVATASAESRIAVDEILLAIGRVPNIESLNLAAANVDFTKRGVTVNDYLQTTNPNVYAAGDVALPHQFTHAAGHAASIVFNNALFSAPLRVVPKRKYSDLIMPWATYTSPEVAHVGLSAHEVADSVVDTHYVSLKSVDRGVTDSAENGFIKLHTQRGSDKIVGATIVAENASEMITSVSLAMKNNLGLGAFAGLVMPYPTQSEAIQHAAMRQSIGNTLRRYGEIFGRLMSFTRR